MTRILWAFNRSTIIELKSQLTSQNEQIQQIVAIVEGIRYAPPNTGGPGYQLAEEHYNQQSRRDST